MTFRQSADKRMAQATVATPGRRLVAGNLPSPLPDWKLTQVTSLPGFNEWETAGMMFYPMWNSTGTLVVQPSFLTDLASIPEWLWSIYCPYGDAFGEVWLQSAIVHDALYASELCSRADCDWTLLEAMQAQGCSWFTRNTFYTAVRAAGWSVWNKHTPKSIAAARQMVSLIPS